MSTALPNISGRTTSRLQRHLPLSASAPSRTHYLSKTRIILIPCFRRPSLSGRLPVYSSTLVCSLRLTLNPPEFWDLYPDTQAALELSRSLQYHFHFHADGQKVPLQDVSLTTHELPPFFHDDLLTFEEWPEATTLFPQDILSPPSKGDILAVSCPEFDTTPSPVHGITWCNGLARSPEACTSGPSLSILDWHNHTSETSGDWECYPCHTPETASLQLALSHTIQAWCALAPTHLTPTNFSPPVLHAYLLHISSPRQGVASWRFPPHSLFTSTFSLLLRLFQCEELLLEGFGSGAYSVAVTCNLAFSLKLFSSILTSIAGVAMHPPTLKTCIDNFVAAHLKYQELLSQYQDTSKLPTDQRPKLLRPHPLPNTFLSLCSISMTVWRRGHSTTFY